MPGAHFFICLTVFFCLNAVQAHLQKPLDHAVQRHAVLQAQRLQVDHHLRLDLLVALLQLSAAKGRNGHAVGPPVSLVMSLGHKALLFQRFEHVGHAAGADAQRAADHVRRDAHRVPGQIHQHPEFAPRQREQRPLKFAAHQSRHRPDEQIGLLLICRIIRHFSHLVL